MSEPIPPTQKPTGSPPKGRKLLDQLSDAIRADFAQQGYQFGGGFDFTGRRAKGVAANIANRPETKGEFVFGFGSVIGYGNPFGKVALN